MQKQYPKKDLNGHMERNLQKHLSLLSSVAIKKLTENEKEIQRLSTDGAEKDKQIKLLSNEATEKDKEIKI